MTHNLSACIQGCRLGTWWCPKIKMEMIVLCWRRGAWNGKIFLRRVYYFWHWFTKRDHIVLSISFNRYPFCFFFVRHSTQPCKYMVVSSLVEFISSFGSYQNLCFYQPMEALTFLNLGFFFLRDALLPEAKAWFWGSGIDNEKHTRFLSYLLIQKENCMNSRKKC